MVMWTQPSRGGRSQCKYYKACGSTDNCKRCTAFEKEKRNGKESAR